jgi:hypothetical protein
MTLCCSPAGVCQSVGGAYVCLVRLHEYEEGVFLQNVATHLLLHYSAVP